MSLKPITRAQIDMIDNALTPEQRELVHEYGAAFVLDLMFSKGVTEIEEMREACEKRRAEIYANREKAK